MAEPQHNKSKYHVMKPDEMWFALHAEPELFRNAR